MNKPITRSIKKAVARNLREFGYTDLTDEEVFKEIDALLRDEKPTNIIGMMSRKLLQDGGYLNVD